MRVVHQTTLQTLRDSPLLSFRWSWFPVGDNRYNTECSTSPSSISSSIVHVFCLVPSVILSFYVAFLATSLLFFSRQVHEIARLFVCLSASPQFHASLIYRSRDRLCPPPPFLRAVSGHWINHENLLRRNPCLEYFQRPFFCLHFSVKPCLNHLLEHRTCGGGGDGGDIVKWHVWWKIYPLNNIRLNSVKKVYLIIRAPRWEHRKLVGAP